MDTKTFSVTPSPTQKKGKQLKPKKLRLGGGRVILLWRLSISSHFPWRLLFVKGGVCFNGDHTFLAT